jgi:hypothetical protein
MPIHRLTQNPTASAIPPNKRCRNRRMSRHLAALIAAPNTNMAAKAKPPAIAKTPFIVAAAS